MTTASTPHPRARRRAATLVGAALAVVAASVATWLVARDDGPADAFAQWNAATALADPVNRGVIRPVALVPGELVTIAGRFTMVTSGDVTTVYRADGTPAWTTAAVGRDAAAPTLDDSGFVVRREGRVTVLEAATGAVRWERAVAGTGGAGVTAGGVAVPRGSGATVDALEVLDPADGTVHRTLAAPCTVLGVASTPRTLVVGCDDHEVAVYGTTGDRPTWQGRLAGDGVVDLGAGLIALTPDGGTRQAIDVATGATRFTVADGLGSLYPAHGNDATPGATVLLRDDADLVRLDTADGHEVSRVPLADGGAPFDAPSVGIVGTTVLAVPGDGVRTDPTRPALRRAGFLAWDATTGAPTERSIVGPTSTNPYSAFLLAVGPGLAAVQANVKEPGDDGPWAHTILYAVGP